MAVGLLERQIGDAGPQFSSLVDERLPRIDTDHRANAGTAGKQPRNRAGTAANLQDLGMCRKVDVRKVGLGNCQLLGVSVFVL